MRIRSLLYTLALLVLIIGCWQAAITFRPGLVFHAGSPRLMLESLYEFITTDGMSHIWATTLAVILGLFFGTLLGSIYAMGTWRAAPLRTAAGFYITLFSALPVFALAPLTVIWFGIGLLNKVVVAAIPCALIAAATFRHNAQRAERLTLPLMTVGLGSWQRFTRIELPVAALSLRLALLRSVPAAVSGAFIGEFIAAERGIGFTILKASGTFNVGLVLAGCLCLMLLAFVLEFLIKCLFYPLRRRVAGIER